MIKGTETERYILRPIEIADAEAMYEMDSDPEVHRFLGGRPVVTLAEIVRIIESIQDQYTQNGIGRWAVESKHGGEFIGWAGLKLEKGRINGMDEYIDLGYRLARKHWGKGIASECASASLEHAFTELGLETICAAAHVNNAASNRILEKIGMRFQQKFLYDGAEHNWYYLKRDDFGEHRL